MVVARETGWLGREHRAVVDAELGPRLEGLGDVQTEAEAKRIAYRLDPHGYLARSRGKDANRRVSMRPAPEAMARLTGFVPVQRGVAAHASLRAHADGLIAAGDARSRGQIMADTMVQRLTGQAVAEAVPAVVNLVMTDHTLFNRRGSADDDGSVAGRPQAHGTNRAGAGAGAGADEPAHLGGYGPIPADLARRLVADAPAGTRVWLRRLYADPESGDLVAMDARRREFSDGLRAFLVLRDQLCRTPWCNAPIRGADHVTDVQEGGATSAANGQGLCAACNYAKQAPGWRARPGPAGAGDQVVITTPTGHTYTSSAPDPPGRTSTPSTPPPSRSDVSYLEQRWAEIVLAA